MDVIKNILGDGFSRNNEVGFITKSRELVLKTMEQLRGKWVTSTEVMSLGYKLFRNVVPETPTGSTGSYRWGGWNVFDFSDRTKRYLDYWVKQGKLKHKLEGRKNYYKLE